MIAPPIPADPALPSARGLFEGGSELLGSFLDERGWALEEARPVQVLYRPGRSCLVRYRARARGPAGSRVLSLCAETSAEAQRKVDPPEDFAERFGLFDPVGAIGPHLVWAYPYDPSLRELPDAAWGPSLRERGGAAFAVQPLRYRPRRRGVFRYRSIHSGREWRTSFGKVVPSRKAERTLMASARLHSAGIPAKVPDRLGRQTLVVPEAPGRSLRRLLVEGGSLPSPRRLATLVRRVARVPAAAVSWTHPTPQQALAPASELVLTLLPELRPEVEHVGESVERASVGPMRLVHGDLYEAQVFVDGRYSLGLIDLDDVSLGDPAMDAANFCAHLLVLALSFPAAAERLVAYRRLARAEFLRQLGVSSEELAWREALCALQLSTGPFRVLDPRWPLEVGRRVRLAVRLLEG